MDFLKNNGLRPHDVTKNKNNMNMNIHKLITIDKFCKQNTIKKIKKSKPKIDKKEYITKFVNYHFNNLKFDSYIEDFTSDESSEEETEEYFYFSE
jgi:hypothetical protein